MIKFILFEIEKFFKRKKNIICIVLMIIINTFYLWNCGVVEKADNQIQIVNCDNEIMSLDQYLIMAKSDLQKANANNDLEAEKSIQASIDMLQIRYEAVKVKKTAIEENDWKTLLEKTIQLDKLNVQGIENKSIFTGESIDDIKKRITKNEYLLDHNIRPMNELASITSFNSIRLFYLIIAPLLMIILLFLLASDLVSTEIDEGTFKYLLLQPIKRSKVLMIKFIACFVACVSAILAILGTTFVVLGLTRGFGYSQYPMYVMTGNNNSQSFGMKFISIGKLDVLMILFSILLIATIISIAMLISTIIGNSAGAMVFSVIFYVGFYFFSTSHKFRILDHIAQYIPFTYTNIPGLLNGESITNYGNYNITVLNGIAVMLISSAICLLLSCILFKKKDIL